MQQTKRNYNHADLHPVHKVIRNDYRRIGDDEEQQQLQQEGWDERPLRGSDKRGGSRGGGRGGRRNSRSPPRRMRGMRSDDRCYVDINPLLVIWMDYTKVFYRIREKYHVKVLFRRYDVELVGSRENVQAAVEHTEDLIEQYDYVELRIPNLEADRSKNKNMYRPFVEATHTKEFEQMQNRDRRLCLLVPYKVNQLSGKLQNQFNYEGAEQEKRKLPYNYALLFCRKECQQDFVRGINKLVEMLANLLFNNITPMQAPRFNSRGMMNYRSDIYKNQKQIPVDKLDAVWLAQFDKLEILSKKHKVYIKMEECKNAGDVNIVIKSNKQFFIENAFKMILDEYLRKLMLVRIEFEFPADTNFQDIVTKDMRVYIEDGMRQKLPNVPLDDIKKHRFIDSNEMYLTAQELDDYYKTNIVMHLDGQQKQNKYLYILGLNGLFPCVSDLAKNYLLENQAALERQKQGKPFSLNDPNQSYLQNEFDESRIMDEGQKEDHKQELSRELAKLVVDDIDTESKVKRFQITAQNREGFTVLISNSPDDKFQDDRFLSQADLSNFLKSRGCKNAFMVNHQNKTLTLDVEGCNDEQFLKCLHLYFNHSALLQLSSIMFQYFTEIPTSLIDHVITQFSCSYELLKIMLPQDHPFEQPEYFGDTSQYTELINNPPQGTELRHYLHLNNFPYFQRDQLLNAVRVLIGSLRKHTYSDICEKLPAHDYLKTALGNIILLNPVDFLLVEENQKGEKTITCIFQQRIEEDDHAKISLHLRQYSPKVNDLTYFFKDLQVTQRTCERIVNKLSATIFVEYAQDYMRIKGDHHELERFNLSFMAIIKGHSNQDSAIFSSQSNSSIFQFAESDHLICTIVSSQQLKFLKEHQDKIENDYLVKLDLQGHDKDTVDFTSATQITISGNSKSVNKFVEVTSKHFQDELPSIKAGIEALQVDPKNYAKKLFSLIGHQTTNFDIIKEINPLFYENLRRLRFKETYQPNQEQPQLEHIFLYETKVLSQGQIDYLFPQKERIELKEDSDYIVGLFYGRDTNELQLRNPYSTLVMRFSTRRKQ